MVGDGRTELTIGLVIPASAAAWSLVLPPLSTSERTEANVIQAVR